MNERSSRISKLLKDTNSRASYVKAKLGVLVPAQIRALRLKSDMPRQSDLAREAGVHQSRISMFETPGAANVTLETLAKLAAAFRVGLVVKFVPFSDMLRWENEFSQDEFKVTKLDDDIGFLDPAAAQAQNYPTDVDFVLALAERFNRHLLIGAGTTQAVNTHAKFAREESPSAGLPTLSAAMEQQTPIPSATEPHAQFAEAV